MFAWLRRKTSPPLPCLSGPLAWHLRRAGRVVVVVTKRPKAEAKG